MLITAIECDFAVPSITEFEDDPHDNQLALVENCLIRRLSLKQQLGPNLMGEFKNLLKYVKPNFNMFNA